MVLDVNFAFKCLGNKVSFYGQVESSKALSEVRERLFCLVQASDDGRVKVSLQVFHENDDGWMEPVTEQVSFTVDMDDYYGEDGIIFQ